MCVSGKYPGKADDAGSDNIFKEGIILFILKKVIKSLQEHFKIYYCYITGEKDILNKRVP